LSELLSKVIEEPSILDRSVYSLNPDEVERLRSEVEAEVAPTFVFSVVDILFEILALEKEAEPYQAAVAILDKALDAFLTLGEFQKAGDLLKRAYIILKTYELKNWQSDAIRNLIMGAGEDLRIEQIGRVLEREEGIRLEDVNGYLVLLQRNSIKPLIKLLGELSNSKARRVLCDTLAQVGKNASETFIPFIDDHRWYLVRNVVYILGRIGKEQFLPHIQKVMNHEEPRVRREAAQALGIIGGAKAIESLIKALEDADVRVRAVAALNLGKMGKKDGVGPLLAVIQSKEFSKREPVEVKAFFDAIGMTGSNESIPVLRHLLERKSWFSKGKMDDVRLGAATALGMIGTPEAGAVLKAGKDSKDESVRNACLQALKGKHP
jgi:tetratricopeptide (TPR) repeat protein